MFNCVSFEQQYCDKRPVINVAEKDGKVQSCIKPVFFAIHLKHFIYKLKYENRNLYLTEATKICKIQSFSYKYKRNE